MSLKLNSHMDFGAVWDSLVLFSYKVWRVIKNDNLLVARKRSAVRSRVAPPKKVSKHKGLRAFLKPLFF